MRSCIEPHEEFTKLIKYAQLEKMCVYHFDQIEFGWYKNTACQAKHCQISSHKLVVFV